MLAVVEREAREVAAKHGVPRRTAIVDESKAGALHQALTEQQAALAAAEAAREVLVMWSGRGFVRRVDAAFFTAQRKGGKGKGRVGMREGDQLEEVVRATAGETLLVMTEGGRAYSMPAAKVPPPTASGYGTAVAQVLGTEANVPMVALVPLGLPPPAVSSRAPKKKAGSVLAAPEGAEAHVGGEQVGGQEVEREAGDDAGEGGNEGVDEEQEQRHLVMLTRSGGIKKTPLTPNLFKTAKAGTQLMRVRV